MKPENSTFKERLEYMSKMTQQQWELVCRGCGLCCLCKYYVDDDNSVAYARVACKNLDLKTRRCKCYECRLKRGACHNVSLDIVRAARVLPANCAYVEILYGPAAPANCAQVNWDDIVSEADISPVAAQRRIIPGSTNWSVKKTK